MVVYTSIAVTHLLHKHVWLGAWLLKPQVGTTLKVSLSNSFSIEAVFTFCVLVNAPVAVLKV